PPTPTSHPSPHPPAGSHTLTRTQHTLPPSYTHQLLRQCCTEGEGYKRAGHFGVRAEETSVVSQVFGATNQVPCPQHLLFRTSKSELLQLCLLPAHTPHTHTHTLSVAHLLSWHSMQLLVMLAALMGVLLSVRAAAVLPVDDRSPMHLNRELSKERKELILKLVSGLLDGGLDTNMLPEEVAPVDLEEPLESRLEERAVYNRLSLPQRERKAPCKNFFWKTFTSC
uniref:Somatostatin-1B-like n=2 Tax=Gouania willdenowi TaxID=441366 RepID=A0A8C5I3M4_GOUWI